MSYTAKCFITLKILQGHIRSRVSSAPPDIHDPLAIAGLLIFENPESRLGSR